MNWRIKGMIQKALGGVPGGSRVNDFLQRTVGHLRDLDGTIDSKVIDDWAVMAAQMRELGISIRGADLVEIGTGWCPALPFCFALAGTRACHTFDLNRHLSPRLTTRTIERIRVHLPRIAQVAGEPENEVEERYRTLAAAVSTEDALQRAGLRYHAPADASRTRLPDKSVDAVFSNSVLEHVPREAILAILQEARRVLKPDGVAIHSVNCADHYAYFDRSITPINYLQYSDREWQFWNNSLLYQNRLRPQDFLDVAREAGLTVALCRFQPKSSLLASLASLRVAPQFQGYPPEQLCTTSIDFAGRPTGAD
jgi:SAM-dependent methyltransferase